VSVDQIHRQRGRVVPYRPTGARRHKELCGLARRSRIILARLFTDSWRRCLATITIHELLDSLLSRSTVGYPRDSVASRVLELQIGYVLYMLSTAAGRIGVRVGDTNASFSISIG